MSAAVDRTLRSLGDIGFDAAMEPAPTGWVTLDRYAADPLVLAAGLAQTERRLGIDRRPVVTGGWLVGDVAAAVTWPAAAALLAHDRLIATGATGVAVPQPGSGRRLAARFSGPAPVAGADRAERFATAVADTLAPVLDAVHRRTRRGRYALWGSVSDMVVAAFDRVGDHLGQRAEARQLAERIVAAPSPLVGRARWHDVAWSGGTEHTHVRNTCCLWYQLPGGGLCLTCPRATDHDRRRTLEARPTPPGPRTRP